MSAVVESMMVPAEALAGTEPPKVLCLGAAEELLNEACVLPLLIPDFFCGIRQPWRGVLLFGPPGTGKTLLARATAARCEATFFNCSSSSLLSSLYGESEKVVSTLFEAARAQAPSVLFFDEVDALLSSRGTASEHEASRRVKSEMLSQLDGIHDMLHSGGNAAGGCAGANAGESVASPSPDAERKHVVVIATTNRPWDLDEAMRRRLEKRVYIPLPDAHARTELFQHFLAGVKCADDVDYEQLASQTERYSGADIKTCCREAALMPMRVLIANKQPSEIRALKDSGALDQAITMQHLCEAVARTQPTADTKSLARYQEWMERFGST